jgi:hypothetical protein
MFSGQEPAGPEVTQTESFNIESTLWRVKWVAKAIGKEPAGGLTVVVHSAVSGRPMKAVVENKGAGEGLGYMTEDPRLYHLVVEADHVAWALAVEEGVVGQPEKAK